MRIIGVDLHTRQQSVAMLDTDTGEVIERTLEHEGDEVREFYSALPGPVLVGIEATGSMPWFLKLMEELKIECRVGHPAKVRAAEPRKQKHDRRDARLLLNLLAENRFPAIWMPSTEQRDLRTLLRHRHQWVRMRTRVQHTLQSLALANGLRRGATLWSPLFLASSMVSFPMKVSFVWPFPISSKRITSCTSSMASCSIPYCAGSTLFPFDGSRM